MTPKINPFAGYNPSPEEIISARTEAKLTQVQSARMVFKSLITWKKWESGERTMPASDWDLYNRKIAELS